jgi:hypothetical protein
MQNNLFIINEDERSRILNLHIDRTKKQYLNEGVVDSGEWLITEWLSPDERYVIFLDEIIDIKNKTSIGNIWESSNNFNFFLNHCFKTSKEIPQTLRESLIKRTNTTLLMESSTNLYGLRDAIKVVMMEQVGSTLWNAGSNFVNWLGQKGSEAIQNVQDFASKSWETIKNIGVNISKSDWFKALDLLRNGILYAWRRVRDALYHPIGMAIDAILLALAPETVGITKLIAILPWSLVVSLDIYEIVTGQQEKGREVAPWQQWIFLALDCLGLVATGSVAKGAKTAVQGMKSVSEVGTNPVVKTALQTVEKKLDQVPGMIDEAVGVYKGNNKFYQFLNFVKSKAKSIIDILKKLITAILYPKSTAGKAAIAALTGLATSYGLDKFLDWFLGTNQQKKETEQVTPSIKGAGAEYEIY